MSLSGKIWSNKTDKRKFIKLGKFCNERDNTKLVFLYHWVSHVERIFFVWLDCSTVELMGSL